MEALLTKIFVLLAIIIIAIAVWKWRIFQTRHQLLSIFKTTLHDRQAVLIGLLFAVGYLAVFMILGGKGGRIHVVFGRWIFNTTLGEMLAGLAITVLVMIYISLFVYSIRIIGLKQSGRKGRLGAFGTLLAMLASFCPWWVPLFTALVGAAGALALSHFWGIVTVLAVMVLILSILYTASSLNTADGWGWPSTSS